MTFKDTYLLKSSPTFQLLPGEEANINLALGKPIPENELIFIKIVFIVKTKSHSVKECFKFKVPSQNAHLLKNLIGLFLLETKTNTIEKLKKNLSIKKLVIKVHSTFKVNSMKIKEQYRFKLI